MAKLKHIREPARDIPVFGQYDVVVVGGGIAGVAASIAAAREGARTALIEYGFGLGGRTFGRGLGRGRGFALACTAIHQQSRQGQHYRSSEGTPEERTFL